MPKNLDKYIPFVPADQRAALFGSITDVTQYPRGTPIREGVIQGTLFHPLFPVGDSDEVSRTAYSETMKVMLIAATAISVLPIICSLFMPDYVLGDTQNAVEDVDLTGERVVNIENMNRTTNVPERETEERRV